MKRNKFFHNLVSSFLMFVLLTLNFAVSFSKDSHAIYEGIRPVGSACADNSSAVPCYANSFDESSGECGIGDLNFNPFISNNVDYNMDFSNKTCLGYLLANGVNMFVASMIASKMCNSKKEPKKAEVKDPRPDLPGSSSSSNPDPDYKQLFDKIAQNPSSFPSKAEIARASTVGAGQAVIATFVSPELSGVISESAVQCAVEMLTPPLGPKKCCGGYAVLLGAYGVSMSALVSIYGVAKTAYDNNRICGEGWYTWKKETKDINGNQIDLSSQRYVKQKGKYQKCLEKRFIGGSIHSDLTDCSSVGVDLSSSSKSNNNAITDQQYREYLYGGLEYEDPRPQSCKNPPNFSVHLGYDTSNQRYYMTGPGETPNYACSRFLMGGLKNKEEIAAFECCKKASQNLICIDNKKVWVQNLKGINTQGGTVADMAATGATVGGGVGVVAGPLGMAVGSGAGAAVGASVGAISSTAFGKSLNFKANFCEVGSLCYVAGVEYSIYNSKKEAGYICAQTQSVCPYDHTLAGGTEEVEYNQKNSQLNNRNLISNFCQQRRHCTKIPIVPSVLSSSLGASYISPACKNMVGDSQSNYEYATNLLPVNNRSFSAPLVQCFKETMENNFLRVSGESICLDRSEIPDPNTGICTSGYKVERGQKIGEPFFIKIQDSLRSVTKFAMVFAVLLFGVAIFLALPSAYIEKKVLMNFLVKFSIVSFFVLGDAWQGMFFRSIIGVPAELLNLTFRPYNQDYISGTKNDGCVFPRYDYRLKNESNLNSAKFAEPKYPPGKEYLRPWDILDCKITRAIGYGPAFSVPNIAIMILSGAFFGSLGIVFFFAAFIFAFFLIFITIRAIHIFLLSTVSIILLIYVSPITIALSMFEKTKNVFEGWWKQMFGFIAQPMILFAYLGMLLTVFDSVLIGSARFEPGGELKESPVLNQDLSSTSTNPQKATKGQHLDIFGYAFPKKINCSPYNLDGEGNDIKDKPYNPALDKKYRREPSKDSVYCIFNVAEFTNYNGFEAFDVVLPTLRGMNSEKVNTLFRMAVLMFVFAALLDKITLFAKKLVGGVELKSDLNIGIASKMMSFANAVQMRALRATKKAASGLGKFSFNKIADSVRDKSK